MIKKSTMLVDDFEDEVLKTLKEINRISSWSKEKKTVKQKLLNLLETRRYFSFLGHHKTYLITRIGESYLYDVPLYKRGHLSKFKGKRIRIICTDSGRYTYGYMAGAIGDTPPDKIISKLTRKYTFPEYIHDHNLLYKSPRFIVLQSDPSIQIPSDEAPEGYIDTTECDSILIDGRAGEPIATLKHNIDGSFEGKKLGWVRSTVYPSLRDAIDRLSVRGRNLN